MDAPDRHRVQWQIPHLAALAVYLQILNAAALLMSLTYSNTSSARGKPLWRRTAHIAEHLQKGWNVTAQRVEVLAHQMQLVEGFRPSQQIGVSHTLGKLVPMNDRLDAVKGSSPDALATSKA